MTSPQRGREDRLFAPRATLPGGPLRDVPMFGRSDGLANVRFTTTKKGVQYSQSRSQHPKQVNPADGLVSCGRDPDGPQIT